MKVKHEIRLWLAVIVICFTFLALSAAQTTQYGQSVQ